MNMRLISAETFKALFDEQVERGATDIFDAVEDALRDTPTVCVTTLTTLNALRDAAYRDALERGLWRPDDTPMDGAQMIRAKAMELIYMTDEDRPMTYENALADVVVGALSFAGRFGVDLDAAVRRQRSL